MSGNHGNGLARREWLGALAGFATFALLREVRAAVPARRSTVQAWIARQDDAAHALTAGTITPRAWMDEIEHLAAGIDVAELMATVNRSRLTAAGAANGNDPKKRYVRFLDEATGEPRQLAYGAALFDFEPRSVITPHGHKHMVSAHLVVDGRLRVRNYDRVRDDGDAMVIRPTRDYVARVGMISTMSSERDNIHWFVPQGGRATTFDVVISDLDAGQPSYDIKAIDPLRGERLADGAIRAPIIGFDASSARYTSDI